MDGLQRANGQDAGNYMNAMGVFAGGYFYRLMDITWWNMYSSLSPVFQVVVVVMIVALTFFFF